MEGLCGYSAAAKLDETYSTTLPLDNEYAKTDKRCCGRRLSHKSATRRPAGGRTLSSALMRIDREGDPRQREHPRVGSVYPWRFQPCAVPSILTRRAWMTTVALACVIYPAFLIYLSFGLPGLGYLAKMELLPVGWSEIGLALEQLKREVQEQTQTPTVVVGMDRNFIASEAAFYAVDQGAAVQQTTGSHLFGQRSLMFEFWTPAPSLEGATLLLVSFRRQELDRTAIRKRCIRLDPITEHLLTRNGKQADLPLLHQRGRRLQERRPASAGTAPIGNSSVVLRAP